MNWAYWVVSLVCVLGGVWFGWRSGRREVRGRERRLVLPVISRCAHCGTWPSIRLAPEIGTGDWVAAIACPKSHMEVDRFSGGSPRAALVRAALKWNGMNERVDRERAG